MIKLSDNMILELAKNDIIEAEMIYGYEAKNDDHVIFDKEGNYYRIHDKDITEDDVDTFIKLKQLKCIKATNLHLNELKSEQEEQTKDIKVIKTILLISFITSIVGALIAVFSIL